MRAEVSGTVFNSKRRPAVAGRLLPIIVCVNYSATLNVATVLSITGAMLASSFTFATPVMI